MQLNLIEACLNGNVKEVFTAKFYLATEHIEQQGANSGTWSASGPHKGACSLVCVLHCALVLERKTRSMAIFSPQMIVYHHSQFPGIKNCSY